QLIMLRDNCKSFKHCIRYAFNIFHQIFRDPIRQLIVKYPENHTTEDGRPFWSGSKIFPSPIDFDVENKIHIDFVIAFSHIWADTIGISYKKRYGSNQRKQFKKYIE